MTIGIVEIVRIALINDVFGLTGGSNGIFGIARPVFFGLKIAKPQISAGIADLRAGSFDRVENRWIQEG